MKPVTPPETRDKLIALAVAFNDGWRDSHCDNRTIVELMADFHLSQQSEEAKLLRDLADALPKNPNGLMAISTELFERLAAFRSRGGKS